MSKSNLIELFSFPPLEGEQYSLLQQAPFVGRNNFGRHLNSLSLKGTAVEVGTHRGLFAFSLLQKWQGKILYCVDPYSVNYNSERFGKVYDFISSSSATDRDNDFESAKTRLSRYHGGRFQFIRQESAIASLHFEDNSLDFVYIDGNHSYPSVKADIKTWYSKVKPSGILAGHDFICPNEDYGGWGRNVQRAVIEFALKNNLTIWIVLEPDNSAWSFFMVKPLSTI